MKIARRYTTEGRSPYDGVTFRSFPARIAPFDGISGGSDEDAGPPVIVPAGWSEDACETLIRHCMGMADGRVPAHLRAVPEDDVPGFLWAHEADEAALATLPEESRFGPETDARQVFDRVAGALARHGWRAGYFDRERDARTFFDELRAMMCRQIAMPDIGVLAAAGLGWAYGGHCCDPVSFVTDFRTGTVRRARAGDMPASGPAIHGVTADLAGEGGPMDLWRREAGDLARGHGCGTNLSAIGHDDGMALMDQVAIGDSAARPFVGTGAGTGRAGAARRLVAVDVDHPEAEDFAAAPAATRERDAASRAGARLARRHLEAILAACLTAAGPGRVDADSNPALRFALVAAREAMVPWPTVERLLGLIAEGRAPAELRDFIGLSYCAPRQVTHSRHMVRADDPAIEAAAAGDDARAACVLDAVARSAWHAGETGLLFATAAQAWNPCPASGTIRAASADGAYLFLDDTACGRAHLNLQAFVGQAGGLDVDSLTHAVRLWTVALDIAIGITAGATPRLAGRAWEFRPIGVGPANLAGALMTLGMSYDSDAGRALAASAAAVIGAAAWHSSAAMAEEMGAFPAFERNRGAVLRCARNHARASMGAEGGYEELGWKPVPLRIGVACDVALARRAAQAWRAAADAAARSGLRNAHLTLVAPDCAAMRLLDAAAPGIEPSGAVAAFERTVAGGFNKTLSARVPAALRALGYGEERIGRILRFVAGHGTLREAPGVNHASLRRLGFGDAALRMVEAALASTFDIRFVFSKWTLGETFCARMLGLDPAELDRDDFDLLNALGFSDAAVAAANAYCFGAARLEDAPEIAPEHRAVFHDARRVPVPARIRMMAAVQPFVSGGVGHAVVLQPDSTADDCRAALLLGWRLGLKHLVLSRDDDAAGHELDSGWAQADAIFAGLGTRRAGEAAEPLRAALSVIEGGRVKANPLPPFAPAPGALMSQALALAHTARGVAPRTAAAGTHDRKHDREHDRTSRTSTAKAAAGTAGGAEASPRPASETQRSGASGLSSTDAPIEQRHV